MRYPLSYNTWGIEEKQAIEECLRRDQYTMGKNVLAFEKAFCDKFETPYAVMLNSGSSANLIAVAALFYKKENPLKRGDEVIVPALSWATTYYPLLQYGLKLKFVDIESATLNLDTSLLETAITPQTRMIVAVNILGNPCQLNTLRDFCKKRDLYLFEDNCESMGAKLEGQYCGTFGDVGTFSTFFSHHISTMEGGVLVTESEEIYQLALSLRSHGWTRALPKNNLLYQPMEDDFFEAYKFILPGYNVRPLEIAAAAGIEQLKKFDAMMEIRRANARHFVSKFKNDSRFIIQEEHGESSWFSFTIILDPFISDRKKVLDALKQHEIEYRIITGGNFVRHPVIKYFNYDRVLFPLIHAHIAHDLGFFVGNYPKDLTQEIDHLYEVLDIECQ